MNADRAAMLDDIAALKEALAADITVINWKNIRDNNTVSETNKKPTGNPVGFYLYH